MIPLFNAICHAQDVARLCSTAMGLVGLDDIASESYTNSAIEQFHRLADDLGFVAITKAEHLALTGFIEEVRDYRPEVISGKAHDPQDDLEDVIAHSVLLSFQQDAEALVGPKPKAQKVAA